MKDLLLFVADSCCASALKGLLARRGSLKTRRIDFDLDVPPGWGDPAFPKRAHTYLRNFSQQYAHALVVFDHEGSNRESSPREVLEQEIEALLALNGWNDRAAVIAIAPELEAWVWSASPHLCPALGWNGNLPSLLEALAEQGFPVGENHKPGRPKEAMEYLLRKVQKPRSSAIYFQLASTVGLHKCADPAFLKLKRTLQAWFPAT